MLSVSWCLWFHVQLLQEMTNIAARFFLKCNNQTLIKKSLHPYDVLSPSGGAAAGERSSPKESRQERWIRGKGPRESPPPSNLSHPAKTSSTLSFPPHNNLTQAFKMPSPPHKSLISVMEFGYFLLWVFFSEPTNTVAAPLSNRFCRSFVVRRRRRSSLSGLWTPETCSSRERGESLPATQTLLLPVPSQVIPSPLSPPCFSTRPCCLYLPPDCLPLHFWRHLNHDVVLCSAGDGQLSLSPSFFCAGSVICWFRVSQAQGVCTAPFCLSRGARASKPARLSAKLLLCQQAPPLPSLLQVWAYTHPHTPTPRLHAVFFFLPPSMLLFLLS